MTTHGQDGRRNGVELWILLPAGLSEPDTVSPAAWGLWRPRESTGSYRRALIALPWVQLLADACRRLSLYGSCDCQSDYRLGSSFKQRLGTRVECRACRHYIIYQ